MTIFCLLLNDIELEFIFLYMTGFVRFASAIFFILYAASSCESFGGGKRSIGPLLTPGARAPDPGTRDGVVQGAIPTSWPPEAISEPAEQSNRQVRSW